MMSSKLEWNEFLGLYSQINNCPSMSSSPRPTAGFENYLFSPEKIRDTCSGNRRRISRSPRGRDRSYSPSSSSSSSSSSSGSRSSTYGYIPPQLPDRYGNYVYLPLRDSLRILADVQKILEDACFSFGDEHLQKLLEEKEWDCPEAVELNTWVSVFFKPANFKLLSHFSQRNGIEKDLGDLLDSLKQIRHSVVHRHRLTVVNIESMVEEAIAFCRILGDNTCLKELHAIWGAACIQISRFYKSQPCPPPKPSTLQIPSTPKLPPVSQREMST